MARIYAALVALFFLGIGHAQNQKKSFTVKHIQDAITIDGRLDEAIWLQAESAQDFHQYFPSDSVMAEQQTNIKMLYDDTT